MAVHIYPTKDLQPHDLTGEECGCEPVVEWIDSETDLPYECGPVIVHNAFDGRKRHQVAFKAHISGAC